MKNILSYVGYAVAIALAVLLLQQCSQTKKNETTLNAEIQRLVEENNYNKVKYYELKAKLDSCMLSPGREVERIKFIPRYTRDTIYIDTTDILESPNYYIPQPKEKVETITTYFADSLYKVTSGIYLKGELLSFNQMLDLTRTPVLESPVNYLPASTVKVQPVPAKVRFPRLFITSGLEWIDTPRLQKIDYNAGLTLLDNKNRIFQVRKSLTCTTCGSIDFGVPLIYSKR